MTQVILGEDLTLKNEVGVYLKKISQHDVRRKIAMKSKARDLSFSDTTSMHKNKGCTKVYKIY